MAKKSRGAGGTPATVALTAAGIAFEVHAYEHDPRATSYGLEAAEALGLEPARVLKTLLASLDGALVVAVVPVSGQLDLKALARALGGSRAVMAEVTAAERSTEIAAVFGSFDRRQLQADTTGSLDLNQVWRYRLTGLLRDSNTQTRFTPDNRRLLAPALTWHPGDRTSVTLLADFQQDRTRWSQFVPANGSLFNTNPNGSIPIDTFVGEPSYDDVRRTQGSVAYTADHLFADIWNRPGLSNRDRRLLLIGLLAGSGGQDVLTIQIPAAHAAGELDDEALREITILMCHYAGWPMGSRINAIVEDTIAKAARKRADAEDAE